MLINQGNLQTLYTGFNAAFRAGFGQAPADHEPVTMEVRSSTRTEEYGWLGQWPGMREWVGERTLRDVTQHGYAIRNRKYEASVEVARDDIEDDHHGVYGPMFQEMGRAAAAHPCELVFGALKAGFETPCYDGQSLFDTDHPDHAGRSVSNTGGGSGAYWFLADCSRAIKPVIFQRRRDYTMTRMDRMDDEHVFMLDRYRYGVDARVSVGYGLWQLVYGSRDTLDAGSYEAARAALLAMTGDEGRPLGVRPTHLLTAPSNEAAALTLLNAELTRGGETNIWRGTAKLVVTPWLA